MRQMKCWVVASRIRSMKSSRNWAQIFKWVVSSSRTKSPGFFFFFGWGFHPTFLSLPSKRTVLKLQTPDFLVYVIMLAEWNHGRRRKCSVLKMKRGRTSFLMSSGLCFKVRCDSDSIQFLFFLYCHGGSLGSLADTKLCSFYGIWFKISPY